VALIDVGSPLTVAGAAPALSRSHDRSAPASLLAPGREISEEPRRSALWAQAHHSSRQI